MEQRPDSYFRDQLYDHEMDVTAGASFEKVMERRKKKRRFIFWWNFRNVAAVGLLFFTGMGSVVYYTTKPDNQTTQDGSKTSLAFSVKNKQNQLDKIQNSSNVKSLSSLNSNTLESSKIQKTGIINAVPTNRNTQYSKKNGANQRISQTSKKNFNVFRIRNSEAKKTRLLKIQQTGLVKTEELTSTNYIGDFFSGYALASKPLLPTSKAKVKDPSSLDWNLELDIAPRPLKLKLAPSVWYAEFSAVTGSNNTINFDDNLPMSILGTQYMAQYQAILLKDYQNGSMFGVGAQYSEWVGNGEWRKNENVVVLERDSHYVRVNMPWQPVRYGLVIDSNYKVYSNTQSGNISYKISKFSFPLAYRFHTQIGKTPIRLGVHLAPGFTSELQGVYFTNTEFQPLALKRHATMDGKITVGPVIQLSRKWTFIIEPSLIYQSFITDKSTVNGKFFTGLGIAVMRQF